jgi:hypothetical protein
MKTKILLNIAALMTLCASAFAQDADLQEIEPSYDQPAYEASEAPSNMTSSFEAMESSPSEESSEPLRQSFNEDYSSEDEVNYEQSSIAPEEEERSSDYVPQMDPAYEGESSHDYSPSEEYLD